MSNYKDFDLDIQKKEDSYNLKDDSNKDKLMRATETCWCGYPDTICEY